MNEKAGKNGVKFEASFGQVLSALVLIVVMLVIPIGGYEYVLNSSARNQRNAYSVETLSREGRLEDQGRVAGVTTSSNSGVAGLAKNPAVLMGIGGVMTTLSLFLIVYMLLPKRPVKGYRS